MIMEYASNMKPVDLEELKQYISDANGYVKMVYLHWSAGRYHEIYDDYHISVDCDGRIYLPDPDLTIKRNHTWKRNSNSVGIAVCGCLGAQANNGYNTDFGSYPVTEAQIEAVSMIIALFAKYGGVPVECCITHCEAAYFDGYGPYSGDEETRWDLWYLPDSGMNGQMRGGGEVLRGKARWYLQQNVA